jgi:hypothetical protein
MFPSPSSADFDSGNRISTSSAFRKSDSGPAIDPLILEWAAKECRVLITRDRQTMIGQAVEQILMTAVCCTATEMDNQVVFLPL